MVCSKNHALVNAVVAQVDEIQALSRYLRPYRDARPFRKSNGTTTDRASAARVLETSVRPDRSRNRKLPYQHLKDELALLLGICGSQLVSRTWRHYHLSHNEGEPDTLRPALDRIFATAARLAAPRGNVGALKVLVRGFETHFFTVSRTTGPSDPDMAPRIALLATIRAGNGAHLLSAVLGCQTTHRPSAVVNLARRQPDQDAVRRRREYLMESASRSKNWTEAYRQTRLLSLGSLLPQMLNHPSLTERIQTLCRKGRQGELSRVTK